jgi:heme oxygenase
MTVIGALRRATADGHARVESHFSSLLSPAPSLDEYRHFLRAMYAFHGAMEPALEARLPRHRDRLGALATDLRALDVSPPRTLCEAPALDSMGRALGAAYVVDGSALGARVLFRHLSPRLPEASFAFLESSGSVAVPIFRDLMATLDAHESELDAILEGAVATFETLERRLSSWTADS